jgi:hypothetical protein
MPFLMRRSCRYPKMLSPTLSLLIRIVREMDAHGTAPTTVDYSEQHVLFWNYRVVLGLCKSLAAASLIEGESLLPCHQLHQPRWAANHEPVNKVVAEIVYQGNNQDRCNQCQIK